VHGMFYSFLPVLAGGGQNQVGDDFGIGTCMQVIAPSFQLIVEEFCVGNIAVVRQGKGQSIRFGDDRLSIGWSA